ncbi:unnamed protein product [Amaranthus hypochondriacus]
MGRAPCCDKANVKKGPWSPEEDAKLKSYIEKHGTGGNWIALPQKIGLKRCGKSCRLRWLNYLRPNIKHGGFSEEEDKIILSLYVSIGSRWSIIAAQLPGRTDNDIKNYWNTRLKKKLLGKQRRDQQQHSRNPSNNLILKQEVMDNKMVNPISFTSSLYNNHNQFPFFPQLNLPNYSNSSNNFHGVSNNEDHNHTSTMKLLMKIEGDYDHTLNPNQIPFHNHHYPNIHNIDYPNNDIYTHEGLMVEGQSSTFPPEIEALMSSNNGNNPQREVLDGLEFLYGGVGGGGGGAGGDYGGDHLVNNHEEMISMGSLPNLELDGNALIQGIEEEGSHFEEHMRYPNNVEL